MVFTCLALSVFSTIKEYETEAIELLFVMEIIVVIWFSIEFALRWVLFPSRDYIQLIPMLVKTVPAPQGLLWQSNYDNSLVFPSWRELAVRNHVKFEYKKKSLNKVVVITATWKHRESFHLLTWCFTFNIARRLIVVIMTSFASAALFKLSFRRL